MITVVCATCKYDEPSVDNDARGRCQSATFSTSGSSYLNVTLTTVHNLYNAVWCGCGVVWCGCGVGVVCLVFGRRLAVVGQRIAA